MQTKIITLVACLALAVAGLAGNAAAASSSCPEVRTACKWTAKTPGKDTRGRTLLPRITPKVVDSRGGVWRAGNHLMS